MGRPGRLESGRGGSDLSVADKDLLLRASDTVHGGLLAPNSPLLTTRDSRREAYCWRRNTRNLQILVVSLTTMLPLSTLSASVSQITELYGSSTYQLVVGLLFLSAFPMALLQVSTLLPMPSYAHKAYIATARLTFAHLIHGLVTTPAFPPLHARSSSPETL